MIDRCQGYDTFVVFQAMGIFRFRRNGEFTVFQRYLQSLPSQAFGFCAGVQFSRDSVHEFNHWIILRENRGL